MQFRIFRGVGSQQIIHHFILTFKKRLAFSKENFIFIKAIFPKDVNIHRINERAYQLRNTK